jgi:glycosyltransferase involved in cell wall biosynthesis
MAKEAKGAKKGLRVVFVTTSTPRRCGIATFSADLMEAVQGAGDGVEVTVAAIEARGVGKEGKARTRWHIQQGEASSYRAAAKAINASDINIVNVQHEFGLYGTWKGEVYSDNFKVFLETLDKPVVTTLHTVPSQPSASLRRAVRRAAKHSDALVVMTQAAVGLLARKYGVEQHVHLIPHGMPVMRPQGRARAKRRLGLKGRQVIATFGLVDPRKGLEHMIKAMVEVVARHPRAVYVIAGQTHPDLVRAQGERYRNFLQGLVKKLGLEGNVRFANEFLSQQEVVGLLQASDVYVTPYLDAQQVTSGTLAYALGAGRAVVSTPYLHAKEALDGGRGRLVGFGKAKELAAAVNMILETPELKRGMERRAYAYAKGMVWPQAGVRWVALMHEVLADRGQKQARMRTGRAAQAQSRKRQARW